MVYQSLPLSHVYIAKLFTTFNENNNTIKCNTNFKECCKGRGRHNKSVFTSIHWLTNKERNQALIFALGISPIANSHCKALMDRNEIKLNLKCITK